MEKIRNDLFFPQKQKTLISIKPHQHKLSFQLILRIEELGYMNKIRYKSNIQYNSQSSI